MRLCHVAHGLVSVPPHGWGAIEASIWDLKHWSEAAGHEFHVVNARGRAPVLEEVNRLEPDVVHMHCELHFALAPRMRARVRIIGSQWPRLYEPGNEAEARAYLAGDARICCVSDFVRRRCLEMGLREDRLFSARNGARSDLIRFEPEAYFPDRAICLGAVNRRKRQHLLKELSFVDFAGPIRPEPDPSFETHPNYMGEWPKAKVYDRLTDYATLVLLSSAEAAPLATCESLMAGLGVVVSEAAAHNLDRTRPFITVVPEECLADRDRLAEAIRANQKISRAMRREIRRYAVEEFDLEMLAGRYLETVGGFLAAAPAPAVVAAG